MLPYPSWITVIITIKHDQLKHPKILVRSISRQTHKTASLGGNNVNNKNTYLWKLLSFMIKEYKNSWLMTADRNLLSALEWNKGDYRLQM